ncbi:MAG: class I tRNA ligase family protein, partial [Deltaproteobacteria bacterium]|nr:class I tRNA ligase family protein [Deltaproteobacteria bacterium]
EVYIHALVRDEYGKKMSKSLGNVIDPLMVMDRYGTDAFRFTLAALAAQGRDIRLSESRIEGYRNFMNKIWNAARFALPYLAEAGHKASLDTLGPLSLPERWILSRVNSTIRDVGEAIETYRFNDAAQALYQFTWHEFCDWFIEQAKIPLGKKDSEDARRCAAVLRKVLDTLMRLLHPFIPFITDEIASKIPSNGDSVILGPFPVVDETLQDQEAEKDMGLLMGLIGSVRNIRAEMNLPPGRVLPVVVFPASDHEQTLVDQNQDMIRFLGKVEELTIHPAGTGGDPPRMSATAVVGEMRVFVPLEGIVDPDAEIARLEKELAKIQKELDAVTRKLSNEAFLSKANPEAIQKQRDRHTELIQKEDGLSQSLKKMLSLKLT